MQQDARPFLQMQNPPRASFKHILARRLIGVGYIQISKGCVIGAFDRLPEGPLHEMMAALPADQRRGPLICVGQSYTKHKCMRLADMAPFCSSFSQNPVNMRRIPAQTESEGGITFGGGSLGVARTDHRQLRAMPHGHRMDALRRINRGP